MKLQLWIIGAVLSQCLVFSSSLAGVLTGSLEYRCKWWHESQMEGMDMNKPPAKETEVVLQKWEYSDPIGVPHPDAFEVVLVLKNLSKQTIPSVELIPELLWKVGKIKARSSAKLETGPTLKPKSHEGLKSGETVTIRLGEVGFKKYQDGLFQKGRWPWQLETKVTIKEVSTKKELLRLSAVLPITPGD